MFCYALEVSPLTSVVQELETLATIRYPGYQVVYDDQALTGYLQRSETRATPLFPFTEADAHILNRQLRPRSRFTGGWWASARVVAQSLVARSSGVLHLPVGTPMLERDTTRRCREAIWASGTGPGEPS